jgi:hypothetical protein
LVHQFIGNVAKCVVVLDPLYGSQSTPCCAVLCLAAAAAAAAGEVATVWAFNFFFYNKKMKRILYIGVKALSKTAAEEEKVGVGPWWGGVPFLV